MRILILGAGAIGTSTAYWLARRGADVIVVERHAVAGAASGRSGGFLARDWCDGTPVMALARRSFVLHAELDAELGGDWGYRPMTTFAGVVDGRAGGRRGPEWVGSEVRFSGQLGSSDTTAQVHPGAYTAAMMRHAEAHGATLRLGAVTGLVRRGDRVVGAEVDGAPIEADAVVIALGPWSLLAAQWLPLPPVFGLKGHSLVFEPDRALPPEALFLEAEDGGEALSPEVFPRADGTVYVCAISTEPPLPVDPRDVGPDDGAIERLTALCGRISPALSNGRVVASGACFRPIASDGVPLIGAVAQAPGAYVATAHSVWGILNAPATGEAMAELILDRDTSLDLSRFDPARLPPLDLARLAAREGGLPRRRG
jgi:glycine/D-amino acid oxidase-like deaminating enzyme